MKFYFVIFTVVFNIIIYAENRSLHLSSQTTKKPRYLSRLAPYEQFVGINYDEINKRQQSENNEFVSYENYITGPDNKCAILLMSNQAQSLSQQSVLRKYRYDQHGALIPSSVRYYIKREGGGNTVLVPLKDKSVSPTGGYLRYYKEVPPIPYNSFR